MDYRDVSFKVTLLTQNRIGVSIIAPLGEVPLMIFASWESYNNFLDTIVRFRNEYHTEIPEAFKKAFANGVSGTKGD